MGKKAVVPDAWDDDWESQADKADAEAEVAKVDVEEEIKISKAERLAKHAETNKKIWASAEEPETFHFLTTRDNVPLKTEFKPALKVLSRKPSPKVVQRLDPLTGLAKMVLEDDDEEEVEKNLPSPEELRMKAQRERDQKQKRYDEARARILGTASGSSSPGTITPPTEDVKTNRGKGRGRANGRQESQRPISQTGNKGLFDPNYTPKPGVTIHKRNGEGSQSGKSTPRDEDQVIRAPRGPDGSGRGGFGFVMRGDKIG